MVAPGLGTIGTANAPTSLFAELLPAIAGLLVLVVIGLVVISWLRRRLGGDDGSDAGDFTLEGLRRLRAEGQISEAEFEQAKAAIIERVQGGIEASENPGSDPPSPPATTG